jgi:5'-3' exonuclease
VRIHLLDGTYELFRHHYGLPEPARTASAVGGTRGVIDSILGLLDEGVTHLGVATDHVIESFRNQLWPGYKTSEGMEPAILNQFGLLEEAVEALGVHLWAMTDLEADDAMASAAAVASGEPGVEQVRILTPDKDLAQCVVGTRVVQFDRRKRELIDEAGVVAKYGVRPESIPDWLALVGDSADGFPGLPGWGAKSAAGVLARYGHIDRIPIDAADWDVSVRGAAKLAAVLAAGQETAALFLELATLRVDPLLLDSVEQLRWTGPTPAFEAMAERLDAPHLARRALNLAASRN